MTAAPKVGELAVQPRRIALGAGPDAAELVRRADGWPGLVALVGDWFDGTPLLTAHPLTVAGAPDVLAEQPVVTGAPDRFVGGGWFGRIAFDGPSRLAFHDHVLRLLDGAWCFEALWTEDRAVELDALLADWRSLLGAPRPAGSGSGAPSARVGPMTAPPPERHLAAVERAIELIRAGELYQVNVCTRLIGAFEGRPAALFADAVTALSPPYAAYLDASPAVVSLSPELFVRRRGRTVVSAPIKGTRARGVPGAEAELRRSAKDTAENVMIVDLVRNDLGRVSEVGSVRPLALLDVQPHPGVWHLVSTVGATLRAGVTDADLLAATFPPGSVTGTPKVRALEAIAALEDGPRGTYTGAIGGASPVWGAEFSVAIRTFEIADGRIALGVGGGITADSVPVLEWRECRQKAASLLGAVGSPVATPAAEDEPVAGLASGGLLETMLAVDGRVRRLGDHLARLDRSCRELFGGGIPDGLARQVRAAAADRPAGRVVVRVVMSPERQTTVTVAPIGPAPRGSDLHCVVRAAGTWRHKWADRSWIDRAAPSSPASSPTPPALPLYVAADGTVLETDRGNVFLVEPDGTLVTPPLRDDLLPGVTRRAVLDRARDTGRPTCLRSFGRDELAGRPAFWTSSLSGAVPIRRVDGVDLPADAGLAAELSAWLFGGDDPDR